MQFSKTFPATAMVVGLATVIFAGSEGPVFGSSSSISVQASSGLIPNYYHTYEYAFQLYLAPLEELTYGDSFTIESLAGINSDGQTPGTMQPDGASAGDLYSFGVSFQPNAGSNPSSSNVTWFINDPGEVITNLSGSPSYIGTFVVLGNVQLSYFGEVTNTPMFTGTVGAIGAQYSVSGTATPPPFFFPGDVLIQAQVPLSAVPEPSSMVLLILGGAMSPLVLFRRKSKKRG